MSTISIIIPSYNQAEYLPDAIESAYNQTTPPHEIIVIDDGSTDGSLEIARQYQFSQLPLIESPVRVVSQANKGLPMARNTGIMNATGDYILPLDADDLLVENAIERITHAIIQFNADIVAPSFRCFGKVNQDVILNNFTMEELKQTNRLGYFSAIRRSALLEVGGYSPRMKYGYEDYHLWFDLFKRGKTLNVLTDILVMYRTKDHSMLNDAQAHHEELMLQIKKDHPTVYG
ncbi:MAG: hypothetical protein A3F10_04980 [Coxiella sp. RIFCSPHIGHO2_12_FULL_42_15]|nr:MAG: hypothetical protein A3F10_04980 [Coxiella sp. RIFCSPHIGHO2_12_FULL_42_15]